MADDIDLDEVNKQIQQDATAKLPRGDELEQKLQQRADALLSSVILPKARAREEINYETVERIINESQGQEEHGPTISVQGVLEAIQRRASGELQKNIRGEDNEMKFFTDLHKQIVSTKPSEANSTPQ